MYKTFTEWKNGNWLENGEPRKEAYTKDELLLVEMGWKYGFDAGKAKQADRIAELEKQTKPLSDDEIISMADSLSLIHYYDSDGEWSGITNEPMFRVEENRNNERLLEILKPFARAIEERHGIK